MSLKARLKTKLKTFPTIWTVCSRTRREVQRIIKLRYFLYDISQTYKAMNWVSTTLNNETLSAQLLFQYHKLEKGLVMPGPKRFFGVEPAEETMSLISKWQAYPSFNKNDPIYRGAIGTLQSYRNRLVEFNLDQQKIILKRLDNFLLKHTCQSENYTTPCELAKIDQENAYHHFNQLMKARRSVRDFLNQPVPAEIIAESVSVALLSPSACNRQPCKVTIINNGMIKSQLLALQNGNKGFGHLAPHIAVITVDTHYFFGANERHEPFIDGGLFSISFLLALKAHNVDTCCLNWCVSPKIDRAAHKLLGLKESLRIVMLVAIGYAPKGIKIPRSPRRDIDSVLNFLND